MYALLPRTLFNDDWIFVSMMSQTGEAECNQVSNRPALARVFKPVPSQIHCGFKVSGGVATPNAGGCRLPCMQELWSAMCKGVSSVCLHKVIWQYDHVSSDWDVTTLPVYGLPHFANCVTSVCVFISWQTGCWGFSDIDIIVFMLYYPGNRMRKYKLFGQATFPMPNSNGKQPMSRMWYWVGMTVVLSTYGQVLYKIYWDPRILFNPYTFCPMIPYV